MEEIVNSIAVFGQNVWEWFGSEDNQNRSTAIATALATFFVFLGGIWAFLIVCYRAFRSKDVNGRTNAGATTEEKPNGLDEAQRAYNPDKPVISLDLYEEKLKTRETELRAELSQAHEDEKALLQAQIDELTRQQKNPEDAFKAFKTRIAELEALLGNAETEDEQAAKDALEAGDLIKADEIFARISAAQNLSIKKAADAEYARGEIAEEQIRWKDALTHFTRAAELDANFKTLRQHWDLLWKMGLYKDAIPVGKKLEELSILEFGAASREHGAALSCRAIIYKHLRRFAEAEPLFRQALEIAEATWGKDDSEYSNCLNNLAALLEDIGRFEEAEPLYREALKIAEVAYGKEHSAYATRLNNLAELFRATGRIDKAEPLFRRALEIGEETLGKEHPNYATHLNNLALLLRSNGRFDEAEPLYRQAIDILEKTLGPDHPNTKGAKQNLQGLLDDMGKSDG